jgi:hypothetical protein
MWPMPIPDQEETEAKFLQFHSDTHGCVLGSSKTDTHLRPDQEAHYRDVIGLWRRELTHMAWCGGVYLSQERFEDLANERLDATERLQNKRSGRKDMYPTMRMYLPKLQVGLCWKKSFW